MKNLAQFREKKVRNISLPSGWIWTTLEQISQIILGQSPPSSTYNKVGLGLPFYQGKLEFGNIHPTPSTWCEPPKIIAQKGDVLLSVRAPVGPTNVCMEKSCIGRGLAAIRPLGSIGTLFVLYLLRSYESEIAGKSTGSTFGSITGIKIKEFIIPLPPLNEQKRIVSRMEELFTKLDAGLEALKKTQILLKQYRQSVLKDAFEGKLTERWRIKNKSDTILSTHSKIDKWEKERFKSYVHDFKNFFKIEPTRKEFKIKVIHHENESPNNWINVSLESASTFVIDCPHDTPKFVKEGKNCIDTTCIRNSEIIWSKVRKVSEIEFIKRISRMQPRENDILFAREGTIGTAVRVPPNIDICLGQRIMMFRPAPFVLSQFIEFYMQSDQFIKQYKPLILGTSSPHLNVRDIKNLSVPIPSLEEQIEINKKLSSVLSTISYIYNSNEKNLLHSTNLRQSILYSAFEGKLVPQDPEDEPAEILLQKIKNERSAHEITSSKPKSNKINNPKQMRLI